MARKSPMTQSKLDELREAYEAWNPNDPEGESATELAARFGITKTTMYNWRNRGFRLDWRENGAHTGWQKQTGGAGSEDLAGVVTYLTEELVAARVRIAELERRLEEAGEAP